MSIFGKIMSSIFGHASAQTPQAAPPLPGETSTSAGAGSPPAASASTSASGSPKSVAGPTVDTGDTNDSARMNVWQHKQVMIKLAENGGKVPDSLKG